MPRPTNSVVTTAILSVKNKSQQFFAKELPSTDDALSREELRAE